MRRDRVAIRSDRRQRAAYRVRKERGTVSSGSQIGRVLHAAWESNGDYARADRVAQAESRFSTGVIGVEARRTTAAIA